MTVRFKSLQITTIIKQQIKIVCAFVKIKWIFYLPKSNYLRGTWWHCLGLVEPFAVVPIQIYQFPPVLDMSISESQWYEFFLYWHKTFVHKDHLFLVCYCFKSNFLGFWISSYAPVYLYVCMLIFDYFFLCLSSLLTSLQNIPRCCLFSSGFGSC